MKVLYRNSEMQTKPNQMTEWKRELERNQKMKRRKKMSIEQTWKWTRKCVHRVSVCLSVCLVWHDDGNQTAAASAQKLLRVTRANSVAIGSNELSSFSLSTSWYHQHRHHCRRRCSRRPRRCHLYRPNCMQRITPANLRWWRRRQCTCWVHSHSPLPVHE